MNRIISKYLAVITWSGFLAWFLWPFGSSTWSFQWEPLLGMVIALSTYVGLEERVPAKKIDSDTPKEFKPRDADIALFGRLRDLFDTNLVAFYRQHSFYASFSADRLRPLFNYVDSWTGVEYEFIDSQLEEEHKKFHAKAYELAEALAKYTTSDENGFASVKPRGYQDGGLPEWAKEEAKELNDKARDFVNTQQALFATARQHLER